MRNRILITSTMLFLIVACNTGNQNNEYYRAASLTDLSSLPSDAEWKAAALPTEDEWKKAATSDKNLNTDKKTGK